ncbi:hypothetical protein [Kitasatospora indigofera]|uniref:hypothetical protein n=1 Tax=Kitasatospora indigofera TaxID=67307 RepID=UPI00368760CA
MAVDWDTLATTGLGAATTVFGIVVGGFVGRRSQDRQRVLDTRSAAYATFLREYAKAEIDLREAQSHRRSVRRARLIRMRQRRNGAGAGPRPTSSLRGQGRYLD